MRISVVTLMLCGAVGCGGGSPATPAPVANAPTLTTPNTSIYIGQSVQFAATGSGTIRWGGDNSEVAAIDQTTGRVTGVGNGRVTIWAENEGGRTTRLLRGLPSYAGTWQGSWVVEGCTTSGAFAEIDLCTEFPVGGSAPLGLSLTQTDDRLPAGNIVLGSLIGSTTEATIAEDGQVRMAATVDPLPDNPIRLRLENIVLNSPSPGIVEGSLEQVWSAIDFGGNMRIHARVANLTRISGGPALLTPRPASGRTVQDMIRLLGPIR